MGELDPDSIEIAQDPDGTAVIRYDVTASTPKESAAESREVPSEPYAFIVDGAIIAVPDAATTGGGKRAMWIGSSEKAEAIARDLTAAVRRARSRKVRRPRTWTSRRCSVTTPRSSAAAKR